MTHSTHTHIVSNEYLIRMIGPI